MWSKVGMGGEHHRYYKHNKFRQNPRGDPKFFVDLTRNDPHIRNPVVNLRLAWVISHPLQAISLHKGMGELP